MRIGEIAKQTGLNISSIRFYERKGLLSPERTDASNYRDYTEEDVLRIKQILLYRKMGISIETIFTLLNDQANLKDILIRQKDILQDEIKNLQGAASLCARVLEKSDIHLSMEQLDQYLNYVYKEEDRGTRFAEAAELLEDMTEYTREEVFYGNPFAMFLYQKTWISSIFPALFWTLMFLVPVCHLIYEGLTVFSILIAAVYGYMIAVCGYGFMRFRRSKQKYCRSKSDRKAGDGI